jgi:hypothetical protein
VDSGEPGAREVARQDVEFARQLTIHNAQFAFSDDWIEGAPFTDKLGIDLDEPRFCVRIDQDPKHLLAK